MNSTSKLEFDEEINFLLAKRAFLKLSLHKNKRQTKTDLRNIFIDDLIRYKTTPSHDSFDLQKKIDELLQIIRLSGISDSEKICQDLRNFLSNDSNNSKSPDKERKKLKAQKLVIPETPFANMENAFNGINIPGKNNIEFSKAFFEINRESNIPESRLELESEIQQLESALNERINPFDTIEDLRSRISEQTSWMEGIIKSQKSILFFVSVLFILIVSIWIFKPSSNNAKDTFAFEQSTSPPIKFLELKDGKIYNDLLNVTINDLNNDKSSINVQTLTFRIDNHRNNMAYYIDAVMVEIESIERRIPEPTSDVLPKSNKATHFRLNPEQRLYQKDQLTSIEDDIIKPKSSKIFTITLSAESPENKLEYSFKVIILCHSTSGESIELSTDLYSLR